MRDHVAEYAIEALLLGLFMVSAGVVTTALEAPGSPLVAALPSDFVRRALIGAAMGLTAGRRWSTRRSASARART